MRRRLVTRELIRFGDFEWKQGRPGSGGRRALHQTTASVENDEKRLAYISRQTGGDHSQALKTPADAPIAR